MEYSFLLKTLWWDLRILAGYLRHYTNKVGEMPVDFQPSLNAP
jgi:hypothetical protein